MPKRLAFLLLFISVFSHGQKHWAGGFGAYNLNMSWGNNDTGGSQLGHSFSLGGIYQYEINNRIYAESGIGYDNLIVNAVAGSLFDDEGNFLYPDGSEYARYGLNYLSIPLKIGFKSVKSNYVFFSLGVTPSFLFLATVTGQFRIHQGSNIQYVVFGLTNISKGSSKFNLPASVELGCGGKLKGGQRLFGSLSLNYHLLEQTLPSKIHGFNVARGSHVWRNIWLQAKIGFNFNLAEK